eukprot:jgi/Ulvmu1/3955/UM018_0178.1
MDSNNSKIGILNTIAVIGRLDKGLAHGLVHRSTISKIFTDPSQDAAMWTLFNRKKSDLDAPGSASAAASADMNHLPTKIPLEARPLDDPKEGPTSWPVTLRFPSMGSERWSLDDGERRSLSAAAADAAASADAAAAADAPRRASTDGMLGCVPHSKSSGNFDLDHVYTSWPSA